MRINSFEKFTKYLTKNSIAVFVTLININCLLIGFANKLCAFRVDSGAVVSQIDLFMYALIAFLFWAIIAAYSIEKRIKEGHDVFDIPNIDRTGALGLANRFTYLKQDLIPQYRIFSFDYVTEREKALEKNDEIWIVTGDLEEDSSNGYLIEIIGNNLEKGIKYRYFITKDCANKRISGKASDGRRILENRFVKYVGTHLFFEEIDQELIAPDIDIIIYNATDSRNKRSGFVCVEIGDDDSTYSYQELRQDVLEDLINQLVPNRGSVHPRGDRQSDGQARRNTVSVIENLYFLVTGVVLATLSFTKIVSLKTALASVIPAFMIWIVLIFTIKYIDTINSKFRTIKKRFEKERNLALNILEEHSLKREIDALFEKEEQRVFNKYNLGRAESILEVDNASVAIWLLTDLSYDIASKNFSTWLTNNMNIYHDLICNILYTDTPAAIGRESDIDLLKSKYGDRVNAKKISSASTKYIWSKTYGMVFVQAKEASEGKMYISLGTTESALFKRVITTENELSTVLGLLKRFQSEE